MAESFGDVFNPKADKAPPVDKPEAPEPKVEAKPEAEKPEAKPDKPRDEKGKFVKGEEVAEPPAAKPKDEPHDPESGLKAGITAERKKRQAAEQRLAEMQQQLEALRTPAKTPDVLQDPDGYRKHIETGVQAQLENQRVDLSAEMARQMHSDFDDVMAEWGPLMQENPALYQQALKAKLPAEWAYQHVKREKFLREVGDPEAWVKAQREKIRAELEPELRRSLEPKPTPPAPPPSLASASSGGRASSEPSIEPKPFAQLFPRR